MELGTFVLLVKKTELRLKEKLKRRSKLKKLVEVEVIKIIGRPVRTVSKWIVEAVVNDNGVKRKRAIKFITRQRAESVKVGDKFLFNQWVD